MSCATKKKIIFKRQGNTYYIDAWVQVPDKAKKPGKNDMDVDHILEEKSYREVVRTGFTRPSHQ